LFTLKSQQEVYTPERKQVIASELLRRVSQLTGVRSAALAENGPLGSRQFTDALDVSGRKIETQLDFVTPGFFDTIGVPLTAGRDFTVNDRSGSPWVIILNRAAARAFFDDDNLIGRTVTVITGGTPRVCTVIGLVGDIPYYDVHRPVEPTAWY